MRRVIHLIAVLGLASCGKVAPESGDGKMDRDSSKSTESDSGIDSRVEFDGGEDSSSGLDGGEDSSGGLDSETDSGTEFDGDSSDEPDPCPGSALECCTLPQGTGYQCEEDFGPASCGVTGWTCLHGGTPASTCSALVCVTLP